MTDAAGPKLGDILVEHGIISQEQLEHALAEQARSGKTLGAVIVEAGMAPGPIIAQALATQRGTMVKTEYGFATGFQPLRVVAPEGATGDPKDREIERLRFALASRDEEIAQLRAMVDQLRLAAVS
ncbi:MAG: hypothetical protein ABUS54_01030 [Actinomycetota bacterium]